MRDRVRIGVVGAGAIAQIAHLPVLSRLGDVEVVALCDNDLPKARGLATRFGIADVYDDIEDLLSVSRPDAVAICTPNHLHEVHCQAALSAGAHVLCERPLALSRAGIESVEEMSRSRSLVVMVGMNSRFRSDVQAIHGFVVGGELGELHSMRCGWYAFRPSRNALGWRLRKVQSGGGAMLDLGLGLIDLGLWLAGDRKPLRVSASFHYDKDDDPVEDGGGALISFEGGLTLFVDVTWRYVGTAERFWLEVMGSGGSAALPPLRVFKEIHGSPVDVTHGAAASHENPFTASYRAEWASFLAAVRGDVQVPSLQEQLVLHRMYQAMTESAEEGREVTL